MSATCQTWVQPPGERRRRCDGEVQLGLRLGDTTCPVCRDCAMRYAEALHEWEEAALLRDVAVWRESWPPGVDEEAAIERKKWAERNAYTALRGVLLNMVRGAEDNPRYREEAPDATDPH